MYKTRILMIISSRSYKIEAYTAYIIYKHHVETAKLANSTVYGHSPKSLFVTV